MIRIAVVHEEDGLRKKLRALISAIPDMEIVGEGRVALDAIDLAWKVKPNVLLLSTKTIPGRMDSFVAAGRIHEESPDVNIILLGEEEIDIGRCLDIGVKGYIPTDCSGDGFLNRIRCVVKRYEYFFVSVR